MSLSGPWRWVLRRLLSPRRAVLTPEERWFANQSLALLQRALCGSEFIKPEQFQRMALDAAHVTFGDITSGCWRRSFPVDDTITVRLPQRFQVGA